MSNGYPYIMPVTGHFSAGKSTFDEELRAKMTRRDFPAIGVINYKSRAPRATELPWIDYYRLVENERDFDRLVRSGDIVVPYVHDNRKYGLSKDFLVALQKGQIPVMITDAYGFANLLEYLKAQQVGNRVVSFMLHTSKSDARDRLFERAGKIMSTAEIEGIRAHLQGLEDEFEIYRSKEGLFRHVIRNNTIDEITVHQRMNHLTDRAMEIMDLEKRINAPTAEDFREAYAGEVVRRLFNGAPINDLVSSLRQGVQLHIPDELIERYATEQRIDSTTVREATKKLVIGAANHYGILSLYLESTTKPEQKKILADLLEAAVGLTHQYKGTDVRPSRDSRLSLKQLSEADKGFIDFLVSFSPYDPMRTPRLDAKVHTITFESILLNRSPHIEPLSYEKAKKFVEGNGS